MEGLGVKLLGQVCPYERKPEFRQSQRFSTVYWRFGELPPGTANILRRTHLTICKLR